MLKLKRLKVHKCRSVQPGTELVFSEGINIVLGKNGAGKTTLLKLVAAAVGSNFMDEFHADDIHVEYEYELNDLRVRCELHQDAGDGDPAQATHQRTPAFRATFISPHQEPLSGEILGDELTFTVGDHTEKFEINPSINRAPSLDLIAFVASFANLVESSAHSPRVVIPYATKLTYRMDEGLDWLRQTLSSFAILFRSRDDSDLWCAPNVRHNGVAPAFRAAFAEYKNRFNDLPEVLSTHSDQLPFLKQACEQIGLRDASWTLSFEELTRRDVEIKHYRRSQLYVTTHGGTRFPLEKLSFGQLRLFAFYLHSAMHPHVVVADELTNGMHHEMVDSCIDTIGERQAFLATQNPLLLDHLGFDSADEVQRTFILCDLQDDPGGERTMHWRNMSAEESHEFFADYKVGVQHTNDILRKRGLW